VLPESKRSVAPPSRSRDRLIFSREAIRIVLPVVASLPPI
jgi:hypothetical protein